MRRNWRPPYARPGLTYAIVRMIELHQQGNHVEADRRFTKLPKETQAVIVLLQYGASFGDLYTRSKGRRNLRAAFRQDENGADSSLLRRVAKHQLAASEPKETP